MLQLCSTRDPSLGECNVEVSLCISLSRGKWFGSDSNDQINYPTSQASPTRWAVDDESSGITHRSRNRSGCSLIPLYRNESLSEWLMMSFGKYKRTTTLESDQKKMCPQVFRQASLTRLTLQHIFKFGAKNPKNFTQDLPL